MTAAHLGTVIVGSGTAGAQSAISLAAADPGRQVTVIAAETDEPYNRPPLSKGFLSGEQTEESLAVRTSDFWKSTNIRFVHRDRVRELSTSDQTLQCESGASYSFDTLVWAAGGLSKKLAVPGARLVGVHSLRSLTDAQSLAIEMANAKRTVVVGGGFIGLECASAMSRAGLRVTVLERNERIMSRVVGESVADYFLQLHRSCGIDVQVNEEVVEIYGKDGRVEGVRTASGGDWPADFVLVGIGISPNIEPLRASGIVCADGVEVDSSCRTSASSVYAAGDCTNFETEFAVAGRVRLESVHNAIEQAKVVAAQIAGLGPVNRVAPWFWSHQHDSKLQTVGLQAGHDEAVLRGSPRGGSFSVIYLREGRVLAVDAVNHVKDYLQAKALVQGHTLVDATLLRDPNRSLSDAVHTSVA